MGWQETAAAMISGLLLLPLLFYLYSGKKPQPVTGLARLDDDLELVSTLFHTGVLHAGSKLAFTQLAQDLNWPLMESALQGQVEYVCSTLVEKDSGLGGRTVALARLCDLLVLDIAAKLVFDTEVQAVSSFLDNQLSLSQIELEKTLDMIQRRSAVSPWLWYLYGLGAGNANVLNNRAFLKRLLHKHRKDAPIQTFLYQLHKKLQLPTPTRSSLDPAAERPPVQDEITQDILLDECVGILARFMRTVPRILFQTLVSILENAALLQAIESELSTPESLLSHSPTLDAALNKTLLQHPPIQAVEYIGKKGPRQRLDIQAMNRRLDAGESVAFGRPKSPCLGKSMAMDMTFTILKHLFYHFTIQKCSTTSDYTVRFLRKAN
ncbi:hypothetical protein HDU91_001473 [Kappamyces sp. JEL0680]|nr:hypothetical protein HDU91_001473 [Kappamyces sp. JEL0680]